MNSHNPHSQSMTQRPLDELKTHPKQGDYFRQLPAQEIRRLAEDIQANGLRHPVEILSDGTIICGHQRVAAAKSLGWTHMDVIIRTDLEAQGEKAIEAALIGDNLHRRQLDPIEKARCIHRLRELHSPESYREQKKRLASGEARDYEKGKFRDYLGKEFGMSGRTVDRYLAVLKAPREVQEAVSAGKLPLTDAAKISVLSEEIQAQIAEAIRQGGDTKKVVRPYLKQTATTAAAKPEARGMDHYVEKLQQSVGALVAQVASPKVLTKEQQRALRRACKSLRRLLPPNPVGPPKQKTQRKADTGQEKIVPRTALWPAQAS